MRIIGVIAEYNPLHNGHMLHLEKIKEENPDLIIGIVSGSMTMRGDLSIFDKFHKTNHALKAGLDLVIELPLAYSMQRGDIFAENTVKALYLAGVNEIIIGSEQNDLSLYENKYNSDKEAISKDSSMKNSISSLNDLSSNDTLGYFYYKAIKDNNYPIELKTIKREKSNYLDTIPTDSNIASASSIRANLELLDKYTPSFVSNDKKDILDENKVFSFIKYKILSMNESDLKEIFFVDEGIEYKLKDIRNYNNIVEFINYLSGKKYTKTRMKRMLYYILFNIKKDEINNIINMEYSPLRILGYSSKGREYLNNIKKNTSIQTNLKNGIHPVFDMELKVSKILDSIYNTNLLVLEQKGPQNKEAH